MSALTPNADICSRSVARKIEWNDEAGKRSDWKAESWYQEREPETRHELGGSTIHSVSSINVILIVADWKAPETPVIDATLVPALRPI